MVLIIFQLWERYKADNTSNMISSSMGVLDEIRVETDNFPTGILVGTAFAKATGSIDVDIDGDTFVCPKINMKLVEDFYSNKLFQTEDPQTSLFHMCSPQC